jgi:hypothetical protein
MATRALLGPAERAGASVSSSIAVISSMVAIIRSLPPGSTLGADPQRSECVLRSCRSRPARSFVEHRAHPAAHRVEARMARLVGGPRGSTCGFARGPEALGGGGRVAQRPRQPPRSDHRRQDDEVDEQGGDSGRRTSQDWAAASPSAR